MKTRIIIIGSLLGIVLLSTACDRDRDSNRTTRNDTGTSTNQPYSGNTRTDTTSPSTRADNTARNKVDSSGDTTTPLDQSQSAEHVKVTADIRRAIMQDSAMSMNAQNCKIVTDKAGMVTLRGVVDTQAEKESIESKAKAVAGADRVINQLEVKNT